MSKSHAIKTFFYSYSVLITLPIFFLLANDYILHADLFTLHRIEHTTIKHITLGILGCYGILFFLTILLKPKNITSIILIFVLSSLLCLSTFRILCIMNNLLGYAELDYQNNNPALLKSPYFTIFDKKHYVTDPTQSFNALWHHARQGYLSYGDRLATMWHVPNDRLLEATFYMNVVSNLWGFGNRVHPHKPGCVLINELNHFTLTTHPSSTHYFTSPIGCCTDYAYMLKYLLDHAHFNNRLTLIGGHVFNEVFIHNHWLTLDPSINTTFNKSWDAIQNENTTQPLTITVYPNRNLIHTRNNPLYRKLFSQFRLITIRRAIFNQNIPTLAHPDLPAYLKETEKT